MILCTYQSIDWKEWKNKKYSDLKRFLEIPEEQNIYWCFAANTIEQATINSLTVTANQPAVFVMFNTEKFIKVDKIKWNKIAERKGNPTENELKDILNIEHEAAVEYLVAGVPEKYFEIRLDLSDLEDLMKGDRLTDIQKIALGVVLGTNWNDKWNNYIEDVEKLFQTQYSTTGKAEQTLIKIRLAKPAFDKHFLKTFYIFGKSVITDSDTSKKFSVSPKKHINNLLDISNTYTKWCINVPNTDNETAYEKLIELYKKIYSLNFVFDPIELFGAKINPNDYCLCGSGKKYKKCCKRYNSDFDIIKIMTEQNTEETSDEKLLQIAIESGFYNPNMPFGAEAKAGLDTPLPYGVMSNPINETL